MRMGFRENAVDEAEPNGGAAENAGRRGEKVPVTGGRTAGEAGQDGERYGEEGLWSNAAVPGGALPQRSGKKVPAAGSSVAGEVVQDGERYGEEGLRRTARHGARLRRSGEVVAALLSLLLGMAALAGAHWWSAADPGRANMTLLRYSSWLPNGLRIGPYGGKELAALVVWLGSWGLLLPLIGRRRFALKPWAYVFLAGVFVLLLLLWPPVYHRIYGWPA